MNEYLPKILIVDDVVINLEILRGALRKKYQIILATSGQQALNLAEQQLPDLILLDIKMPEMDGHEVHRMLRANPRTHDIPVIFITADIDEKSQLQGLAEGADDDITKPLIMPMLRLRIHKLLERKQLWNELKQQRDQFHQEHNFINALLNNASNLIIVINQQGLIIRFNHAAEIFTGYHLDEIKDQPFFWENLLLPEQIPIVRDVFNSFLADKLITRSRNYLINCHGERRLFDWSNSIFVEDHTANRYLMQIGTDITEQRLTEYALQESLHEYAMLVNMIPLGVYKLKMKKDGNWAFEFITQQFCNMLGMSAGEIYKNSQSLFDKIIEDDKDNFFKLSRAAGADLNKFEWEGRFHKNHSEMRWLHIEALPSITKEGDILWHGIQYDVTERKEQEAKLDRIANYDTLTGVPNRRLLADRLRQALICAQRDNTLVGICYLDLDSFKPVNDQFGHAAGDQLLIKITQRLQKTLRGSDTLARLGGDEFVLVLTQLNSISDCENILNRILLFINEPIKIGDNLVTVSASIGVTFYPYDNKDSDTLIRHADHAMYQSKESGKNRYSFFNKV